MVKFELATTHAQSCLASNHGFLLPKMNKSWTKVKGRAYRGLHPAYHAVCDALIIVAWQVDSRVNLLIILLT
jgi:hypothetical protein